MLKVSLLDTRVKLQEHVFLVLMISTLLRFLQQREFLKRVVT